MKHLSQLASKPQLISIVLEDEDTVKEFGEPLEFHTWDRQPLEVFLKLANQKEHNAVEMLDIVRTLILDAQGKQIITDEQTLPTSLMMKVISAVIEKLGK